MELEEEDFKKLCQHHYLDFNEVLAFLARFIKDLGNSNLGGVPIYVGIVPNITFPPSVSLKFELNAAGDLLKAVGYFNIARYLKNNIH